MTAALVQQEIWPQQFAKFDSATVASVSLFPLGPGELKKTSSEGAHPLTGRGGGVRFVGGRRQNFGKISLVFGCIKTKFCK